ncbi:MAG: Helix-turn-helix domain [Firmicutes bacterium]|nr:Helix-turn-helix domain [Bacillota bacterium]
MYNQTILMHVSDAASLLGVSSQTIYKLINGGELKAFKTGKAWKISTQSINDYTNANLNK